MTRSHWIPFPRIEGIASRQAHVDLPAETYERELGREGFYGPSTQMYHRHPPTGWSHVEGPLRPRALDTTHIEQNNRSPWEAQPLLMNANVKIRFWRLNTDMEQLVRNADGDELLFLHAGAGDLYCDYGRLSLSEGDYLLLPRGTLWRIACEEPLALLMIEATGDSFRLPEQGHCGRSCPVRPCHAGLSADRRRLHRPTDRGCLASSDQAARRDQHHHLSL